MTNYEIRIAIINNDKREFLLSSVNANTDLTAHDLRHIVSYHLNKIRRKIHGKNKKNITDNLEDIKVSDKLSRTIDEQKISIKEYLKLHKKMMEEYCNGLQKQNKRYRS